MTAGALRGLVVAVAMLAFTAPAHAATSVLDNGKVRVAVDLAQGGKLTWLSRSQGDNADNLLLEAEPSYYGGPLGPDGAAGWHASLDDAVVLDHSNDGHTLHVRSASHSCECTFDTWLTLHGSAVVMRTRLTSFRSGAAPYPPFWQELPAVYTVGGPYRVVTYVGAVPFTSGAVDDATSRAHSPFFSPGALSITATEHWVALLDDKGFGVGLVEPDVTDFVAISGYEGGWPSGYVAGTRLEQLDANVVYDYTAYLVVGSLRQIRAYAYARRPDPRPSYVFARDRRHFVVGNGADAGFPIRGALRVRDPFGGTELVGPAVRWQARAVPRMYVRGAWHSTLSEASLSWSNSGEEVAGTRTFPIVPDGVFRTYRVDLFREPRYRGTITGVRLALGPDGAPGGWADITCISYKPCPIDRAAERRLASDGGFLPFLDTFDRLDTSFWSVTGNSPEAAASVAGGHLVVDVPAKAKPLPGQDYVSAGVYSRCTLGGDFAVQVDYDLPVWPDANGVNLNFSVGNRTLFRHDGVGFDGVSSYFPPFPGGAYVADDRTSGSLRFVRSGDVVTGYTRDPTGTWQQLEGARSTRDPVNVGLSIFTNRPVAGAQDVQARFDDFRITRGAIACP
jgi:hypothetical protein